MGVEDLEFGLPCSQEPCQIRFAVSASGSASEAFGDFPHGRHAGLLELRERDFATDTASHGLVFAHSRESSTRSAPIAFVPPNAIAHVTT